MAHASELTHTAASGVGLRADFHCLADLRIPTDLEPQAGAVPGYCTEGRTAGCEVIAKLAADVLSCRPRRGAASLSPSNDTTVGGGTRCFGSGTRLTVNR